MKIAIIMPTIRPHAGRSLDLLLQDTASSGIDLADISVYLSIDSPLSSTSSTVQIRDEYRSKLRLVQCIDSKRRSAFAQILAKHCAVSATVLEHSLIGRGYAPARNSALLEALNDGNDFAINVDDDVLPLVPREATTDRIEWISSNLVRSHLSRLEAGADVTRGSYFGYSSPLVNLTEVIAQECGEALGLALSLGNEVLRADCLTKPPPVRFITSSDVQDMSFEHQVPNKGVVIYGGNMGISLSSLSLGRIPAFFCPKGARGEDTFFGLSLPGDARVDTVPAFVFHDPFHLYPCLFCRCYPTTLTPSVRPTKKNVSRFVNAFRGWVRYAPLWIRSQYDDSLARHKTLTAIEQIYRTHSRCLATLDLEDIPSLFAEAVSSMHREFELLDETNLAWRTRLIPYLLDHKR